MKICKYCGWENPYDALFCRNCGKKFRKDIGRLGRALKSVFRYFLGLALVVGLTVGGLWLWHCFTQPSYIYVEGKTAYDITVPPYESELRLAVETDADAFDIGVLPGWISLAGTASPDSIRLTVAANGSVRERTRSVFIYGGKHSATINITQPVLDPATSSTSEPVDLAFQHSYTNTHGGVDGFINNIWFEHDACRGKEKGIVFHVDFDIRNMGGKTGLCAIFFHYDQEGNRPLEDTDKKYCTKSGYVAVSRKFTPDSDDFNFADLDLFIPYRQLDLPKGDYNLRCMLYIRNHLDENVQDYDRLRIHYQQPTDRNETENNY